MDHILSLLTDIRKRPAIYIGTLSVIRLASFLRGYDHAYHRLYGTPQAPFLSGFRDWIHRRYQTTKHSWEDVILIHSGSEAAALDLFWVLLDKYLVEIQDGVMPDSAEARQRNGAPNSPLSAEKELQP